MLARAFSMFWLHQTASGRVQLHRSAFSQCATVDIGRPFCSQTDAFLTSSALSRFIELLSSVLHHRCGWGLASTVSVHSKQCQCVFASRGVLCALATFVRGRTTTDSFGVASFFAVRKLWKVCENLENCGFPCAEWPSELCADNLE